MKKFILTFFILFSCFAAYSQSADVVTEILDTQNVTYGQICYLSAVRQNLISEDSSYDAAVQAITDNAQIKKTVVVDSSISLMDIADLYMKIWPDKCRSLMYKITKSPRYSYKYMKNIGIISDKLDANQNINGLMALGILTKCMEVFGAEDECMSMSIE